MSLAFSSVSSRSDRIRGRRSARHKKNWIKRHFPFGAYGLSVWHEFRPTKTNLKILFSVVTRSPAPTYLKGPRANVSRSWLIRSFSSPNEIESSADEPECSAAECVETIKEKKTPNGKTKHKLDSHFQCQRTENSTHTHTQTRIIKPTTLQIDRVALLAEIFFV